MEQDITVKRVVRDLKARGLISKDITGEVRDEEITIFGDVLWVSGWEQARREFSERTEKPVTQYDASGHKMEDFGSIEKAAKRIKCSRETIARAIRTGGKTARGHIWKFTDHEKE